MFDSSRRPKTCPLFEMAVVAASAMSFLCLIFNYPILIYVMIDHYRSIYDYMFLFIGI